MADASFAFLYHDRRKINYIRVLYVQTIATVNIPTFTSSTQMIDIPNVCELIANPPGFPTTSVAVCVMNQEVRHHKPKKQIRNTLIQAF